MPPRWPPRPSAVAEPSSLTYELAIVPLTSISLVTALALKVDADAIADRHRRSAMEAAVADYVALSASVNGELKEADWSKVRGLEFREALQERDDLGKKLDFLAVEEADLGEPVRRLPPSLQVGKLTYFDAQYSILHSERVLEDKIASYAVRCPTTRRACVADVLPPPRLRMALSDQNLELLPDYEQRIAVLKELQFIDDNSTVQLKGRVACEVRIFVQSPQTLFSPSRRQINSANELVLTELILDNVFASYEPEEVVALLSGFIFQEKTDVAPLLTPRLEEVRCVASLAWPR